MEEEKTESVKEPEIVMEEKEDSMSEEIQTVIERMCHFNCSCALIYSNNCVYGILDLSSTL